MRAVRLLRSTEGVGAESHRVAKVAQGGRSEESRGVAESQHIAQASRLGGGGEVCMCKIRASTSGRAASADGCVFEPNGRHVCCWSLSHPFSEPSRCLQVQIGMLAASELKISTQNHFFNQNFSGLAV